MNPLAEIILAELRDAETVDEIHSIADRRRSEVMAMKETDTARFHHIVNMKKLRLGDLEK